MDNLTLNDFRNMIGTHSVGYVDFTRSENGEVTGLKKVANHRTFTILNSSEATVMQRLGGANAIEMRKTFIDSLRKELGVDLPPDLVRAILCEGDGVNERPLSRREIRQVIAQVDDLKQHLAEAVAPQILVVAREMGVPETGADGAPSPVITAAKDGYAACKAIIADCFRPGYEPDVAHIKATFLNVGRAFRDALDRYGRVLDGLSQTAVLSIVIQTMLDDIEPLREWVTGHPDRVTDVIDALDAERNALGDLPGLEGGNAPTARDIANYKKLMGASAGYQLMCDIGYVATDYTRRETIANNLAAEFGESTGASAIQIKNLLKRMTRIELLARNPRPINGLLPEIRSLLEGFAEIRRRQAERGDAVSSFDQLVDEFAGNAEKLRALNFALPSSFNSVAAAELKKTILERFDTGDRLGDYNNWANISMTTVREVNPNAVTINGVPIPPDDPGPFKTADGRLVGTAELNQVAAFAKRGIARALVKGLVLAFPDKRMRAFVSLLLSMANGPRGFLTGIFHINGSRKLFGDKPTNYARMLEQGVMVSQPTNDATHAIDIAEDGTVTVTMRAHEGFGVGHANNAPLAVGNEPPHEVNIPLVKQCYETRVVIQPNSFNAHGVPDFSVSIRRVD